jgi:hypothetical protein
VLVDRGSKHEDIGTIQKAIAAKNHAFMCKYGRLVYVDHRPEHASLQPSRRTCTVFLNWYQSQISSGGFTSHVKESVPLAPLISILRYELMEWSNIPVDKFRREARVREKIQSLLLGFLRAFPRRTNSTCCLNPVKALMLEEIALKFTAKIESPTIRDWFEQNLCQIVPGDRREALRSIQTAPITGAASSEDASSNITRGLSSLKIDEDKPVIIKTNRLAPRVAQAAREAIKVLKSQGYSAAIVGSLASYQYGASREPNVRIIVHF